MKTVPPSVAELQRKHGVPELECIDRIYLNAYMPKLTSAARRGGIADNARYHHVGDCRASCKKHDVHGDGSANCNGRTFQEGG
ncbi:MAG TPA: hypothetical protein VG146_04290 [Verrucomicrobiae bacterium]|nr:hypothetical protein [Verrucomicrobiae bacterium]